MEIVMLRTYNAAGTNSQLLVDGSPLGFTIELPWAGNARQISCIPEGTYNVVKRTSAKYGRHLLVEKVPNRSLILFHPANNAKTELRGCIAPVTRTTGPGRGVRSTPVFEQLRDLAYAAIDRGEPVILTIKKA